MKLGNEAKEPVTVVFAADNAYSPYLATVMESIIENSSPEREYCLVALHSSISEETNL